MKRDGHDVGDAAPRPDGRGAALPRFLVGLRAALRCDLLPKQGSKQPWRLYQNYLRDLLMLRFGRIDDGVLVFSNPVPGPASRTTTGSAAVAD